MNLSEFLSERLVQAFGWTILHSLWQGALIAILLGLLMIVMRSYSSYARYFVSVSALATIFLLAVVTFITSYNGYIVPTQTTLTFALPSALPTEAESVERVTAQATTLQTIWASTENYFRGHFPLLVSVWLLGVMLLLLRFIGGYAYLQRLKTYQVREVNNYWKGTLTYLASEVGIKQKVRLLESALAEMPMVIGWLKPVILLPLGTLSGLSIAQVESILAHELAHLKRRDYLVNIFQSILEIVLFYNPFVWWVSGYIRDERENCCDDIAVNVTGDSLTLVKTLTMLEEFRLARPQLAMGFAGRKKGGLLARVRRLLSRKPQASGFSEGFLSAMVLVFCFSITTVNAYTPYNWHNLRTLAHKSWEKIQEVAGNLAGKGGNIEIIAGEPPKTYLPTPASVPNIEALSSIGLSALKPLKPLGLNDTIRFGKGLMGITDRKGGLKMYKDGVEIPKEDFGKYKEDFAVVQTPKKAGNHAYIYTPYDHVNYNISVPELPNLPNMPVMLPMPPIPNLHLFRGDGNINGQTFKLQGNGDVIIIDGKKLSKKDLKKFRKNSYTTQKDKNIEQDWERWGEDVGKRMEKWGEQFEKQGDKWEQWGKQMEKWGEQFGKQFENLSEEEREEIEQATERISKEQAQLDEKIRNLRGKDRQEAERKRNEIRQEAENLRERQHELQEEARELKEEARELKENAVIEAQNEARFAPIKEILKQDGFWEKDAKSFKIEADKDGIKINGKKLTPEQEAKYRPLFQQYIGIAGQGKETQVWMWNWEED